MSALSIINDLKQDTAILIEQRSDKETELECLERGLKKYQEENNIVKINSYNMAKNRVEKDIEALNKIINDRLREIRIAESRVNNQVHNFFKN